MLPNWSTKQWMLSHCLVLSILLLILVQVFAVTNNKIKITVLDVGQGDAILIQTPEYKNILIDAGDVGKINGPISSEMLFFRPVIDLFILTHPHRDHFAGFFDLIQKYEIKSIMITGVISHDPLYKEFIRLIKSRNIPITYPSNAEDIQISHDLFLDILYPFTGQSLLGHEVRNKNNSSIVINLSDSFGSPLMILTGDAEEELEREILLSGQTIKSPVLKLGHHGSKTATSDDFLSAVSPKTAIISAGFENIFNHPHIETMEKINGLDIRNTMDDGSIQFNF